MIKFTCLLMAMMFLYASKLLFKIAKDFRALGGGSRGKEEKAI